MIDCHCSVALSVCSGLLDTSDFCFQPAQGEKYSFQVRAGENQVRMVRCKPVMKNLHCNLQHSRRFPRTSYSIQYSAEINCASKPRPDSLRLAVSP